MSWIDVEHCHDLGLDFHGPYIVSGHCDKGVTWFTSDLGLCSLLMFICMLNNNRDLCS